MGRDGESAFIMGLYIRGNQLPSLACMLPGNLQFPEIGMVKAVMDRNAQAESWGEVFDLFYLDTCG